MVVPIGAFVRVCREGEWREGVYGPCFVVQYLMSFPVLQSISLGNSELGALLNLNLG